jgi:hypothetical protein
MKTGVSVSYGINGNNQSAAKAVEKMANRRRQRAAKWRQYGGISSGGVISAKRNQ